MNKVAIIGKQQPIAIRTAIKEYLEENGLQADIINMETRNALDWTDRLIGYNAIISAGEKFPAEVFRALKGDLKLLSRYGVGTDEIDKAAAAECGVAVCKRGYAFHSGSRVSYGGLYSHFFAVIPDAE